MTVHVIYRGEKAVDVVRKVAIVKLVHDFTEVKGINVIQLEKVEGCFPAGATVDFFKGSQRCYSRGAKSGEISFFSRESKKTTLFC